MYSARYWVDPAMKVWVLAVIATGVGGTGESGGYWWMDTDGAFGGRNGQQGGNNGQNSQHNSGGRSQKVGGYQQNSGGSNGNGQHTGSNGRPTFQNKSSGGDAGDRKALTEQSNGNGRVKPNTPKQKQNRGKKEGTQNGAGKNKGESIIEDDCKTLSYSHKSLTGNIMQICTK